MKRVLATSLILLLLTASSIRADEDVPQEAPVYSKDFLDRLFRLMPQSVGDPLFDLRHTILRLAEEPDSASLLKTNGVNGESDFGNPPNWEFGPHSGDGGRIFKIGDTVIRGNLKFTADPRYFAEPRPSGETESPPASPPADLDPINQIMMPILHKSHYPRLSIAVEF